MKTNLKKLTKTTIIKPASNTTTEDGWKKNMVVQLKTKFKVVLSVKIWEKKN